MSRLTRQFLRIPRPKSLFGFISLQAATELIALALCFNKVTGVYGLLAILTGYQLSLVQLSTYLYSIVILVCLAYLVPHIRRQSPLECLGLAWLYIIDTIINAAYAATFGMTWYFSNTGVAGASPASADGLVVEGTEGLEGVRHAAAQRGDVMPQDTATSMLLIIGITLIRVHFSLVVMSYACETIQKYMQRVDTEEGGLDGPFAIGLPEGEGRRGRAGRLMVSMGRAYWLDVSDGHNSAGKGWRDPQAGMLAGEV